MAQDRFIEKHKTAWQRLEDLLKLLDGSSLRKLHREEVRELGRIYRRTASDLAIARAESRDPRLIITDGTYIRHSIQPFTVESRSR